MNRLETYDQWPRNKVTVCVLQSFVFSLFPFMIMDCSLIMYPLFQYYGILPTVANSTIFFIIVWCQFVQLIAFKAFLLSDFTGYIYICGFLLFVIGICKEKIYKKMNLKNDDFKVYHSFFVIYCILALIIWCIVSYYSNIL